MMAVFSLSLDKVNNDGPSLNLRAGFSASLLTQKHGTFHQNDALEDQSEGICCMIFKFANLN